MPKPIDFLIVAPFDHEREIIEAVFRAEGAREHQRSVEDDVGTVDQDEIQLLKAARFTVQSIHRVEYDVVVVQPQRKCRVPAAVALRVALKHWHPVYVLLVGIAGALPDSGLSHGEVVVPEQIYDYEKASSDPTGGVINDLRVFPTYTGLGQGAPNFLEATKVLGLVESVVDKQMAQRLRSGIQELGSPDRKLEVRKEGNAISGDKKIKEVVGLLGIAQEAERYKIFCVEMEAGGVAEACKWDEIKFLMIRGISDIVGGETDELLKEEKQWLAAVSAALVAFEIISKATSTPAIMNSEIPVAYRLPRPVVLGNAAQAFDYNYPLMYVGTVWDYELLAYGISSRATDFVIWVSNGSPLRTKSWKADPTLLKEWDKKFRDLNCQPKARLVVFRNGTERSDYCHATNGTLEAERIKRFKDSCGEHLYFTTLDKIKENWKKKRLGKFELTEGIDMGFVSWVNPGSAPVKYCFCSPFNTTDFQDERTKGKVSEPREDLHKIITVFSSNYSGWESTLKKESSPLWQAKNFYEAVIIELSHLVLHGHPELPWVDRDPASPKLEPGVSLSTAGGHR